MSGSNPYAVGGSDPYAASSTNSFGSQERRRRSNPYDRNDIDGASPAPMNASRGYGGLPQPRYYGEAAPAPSPRQEPDYRDEQRQPSRQSFRERERAYNESQRAYNENRSQERGEMPRPRKPPSFSSMPQNPSLSRLNENTNGYTAPSPNSYPPPQNANRHYSPRRPAKSMEEIMRHIQVNWKDMEGDECVPVKVALRLEDPSSLGLADKEGDFSNTHVDLQKCLKSVVNEHYADFNSAVGTYHKIQNAINESQARVRQLKLGLMNVKDGMLSTRPELRGLAEESGELDVELAKGSKIEFFKNIPARLEEKISEKKFLGAVDLLMNSLKNITKSDFENIGGLADMRSYLTNQETTLLDILIEELHDHLYLRSPYCKDRWKGKKSNGDEREPKEHMLNSSNAWDRPFNHYLSNADFTVAMVEDPSRNPEADTFYYIHMIIESLSKLGQLEEAVSRIEQRMPMELYKVVEKTNHDIDAKYPIHTRGQLAKSNRKTISMQTNDARSHVLSDFLWTLYSKFEVIAESHRVLHEVIGSIATREQLGKPEKYSTGFKELWKLYQMEMRSILHDYLATDGENAASRSITTTASNDVFARSARDKSKRVFGLAETDSKLDAMRGEENELDDILKSSVPGLVNKNRALELVSDRGGQDSTAAGHKLLIEPGVFNMTVLLTPSLTFLQRLKDIVPATAHIPMSTLTSFLDNFLINVFQPQLEEAVTELCAQAMIDLEAFNEDPQWAKHSVHPVFKGTVAFMNLIRAFSGMLGAIPQDQMFTQVIIDQIITYYDKCYGFYKAMVSRVANPDQPQNGNALSTKAAAALAASGDVHDAALQLLNIDKQSATTNGTSRTELTNQEVKALLAATKSNPLSAYDIISDPKSVHQLSLLYNSMQWLAAALTQIRHVEGSSHTGAQRNSRSVRRWTLLSTLHGPGAKSSSQPGATAPILLPLTSETAVVFDETISSIRKLAQTSLLTLHIDIRCGMIHQLTRVLRSPDSLTSPTSATATASANESRDSSLPSLDSGLYAYVLPTLSSSASPLILELNNDLIAFDSNIASYLGVRERAFILSGLGRLVDRYWVVASDGLGVVNGNGAERMRMDIMVVQQNLRAILAGTRIQGETWRSGGGNKKVGDGGGLGISATFDGADDAEEDDDDGLLESSGQYFDMFLAGPDEVLKTVRDSKAQGRDVGYTYDELRTLLELCYSAKLRGEDREESVKARKGLQDALLALGEGMWDS